MKKRVLLLCILTILFSTGMEGCPALDPMNYVVFTVNATYKVYFAYEIDGSYAVWDISPYGTQLSIRIQKAGGEQCFETVAVGVDGNATLNCTHNVYKEQPVEVSAAVLTLPEKIYDRGLEYTHESAGSCVFTWSTIFSNCAEKFGSSCSTNCECSMLIYLEDPEGPMRK